MIHAETGGKSFDVIVKDDGITVDGHAVDWDIAPLPDGRWHILFGKEGFTAEVVSADRATGTYQIRINGALSVVTLRTPLERRLAAMGFENRHTTALSAVAAPMPGLITSIRVAVGDQVLAGTPLLVLEAMKMENVLQAPGEGTVSAVRVNVGDRVEKGQSLIEF